MTKTTKTITLDPDIVLDIKENALKRPLNFSAWVSNAYRETFMGIKAKRQQIREREKSIEELKIEIQSIDQRNKEYHAVFTPEEMLFLKQAPMMLEEGKTWEGLQWRFNNQFKKNLNLTEFRRIIIDLSQE